MLLDDATLKRLDTTLAHGLDMIQCALGMSTTGPVEFYPLTDGPEGALGFRYANGVEGVIYQRGAFKDRYIRYIGDEGWIQVDDETDIVTAEPKSILSLKGVGGVSWADNSQHIRNLLSCIRSRTPTKCNPEVGHRAQSICQCMTISSRLNKKLKWDPVAEKFNDDDANRMLFREPRAPWRI